MTDDIIILDEPRAILGRLELIEQLWFLMEQGAVIQVEVAPLARALGYGNTRDCLEPHFCEDYWGAIDTLLLLVLAAEGEELPS